MARKVNIGKEEWRVCYGTYIRECFKCKGYKHKSSQYKYEEICIKCHGSHKSNVCNQNTINKCINCVKVNNWLNLGLNKNHSTHS